MVTNATNLQETRYNLIIVVVLNCITWRMPMHVYELGLSTDTMIDELKTVRITLPYMTKFSSENICSSNLGSKWQFTIKYYLQYPCRIGNTRVACCCIVINHKLFE